MEKVSIHSDYITLQALLKLTGYIGSGGEVKHFLSTEQVLVNEEREIRRGRKLYSDDINRPLIFAQAPYLKIFF